MPGHPGTPDQSPFTGSADSMIQTIFITFLVGLDFVLRPSVNGYALQFVRTMTEARNTGT